MWGLAKKTATTLRRNSRLNLFVYASVALVFICIFIFLPKTEFYKNKKDTLIYLMHETALSAGLSLEEVFLEGRVRSSKNDLFATLNVTKGMPITAVDIYAIRERLLRQPWVKNVTIERRLPHFLFVDLVERTPIAVYQRKDKYTPIDENGQLIEITWKSPRNLPVLVGTDAYEKAPELIEFLSQEPELFKRVKGGIRIGKRRWDILLEDLQKPIIIRLPETDQTSAWSRLARLERTENILKRKITMIDLRLPDRISVRLEEGLNKQVSK